MISLLDIGLGTVCLTKASYLKACGFTLPGFNYFYFP